ncbi:Uu.00g097340.m01.CDS01 [Anthostomella pinea]|uniref:Uu.00g097340.m01.CDS01 n=1 Tax=Anthostomella pinea TaxID=933095 RepID=A0AAI8VCC7_9PEZI|nr:Uu.00g097340.m01.CDS01 [Anthostomella pinea]
MALEGIKMWSEIATLLHELQILRDRYPSELPLDDDLPEALSKGFLNAIYVLKETTKPQIDRMDHRERIFSSPELRNEFFRISPPNTPVTARGKCRFELRQKAAIRKDRDEVLTVLSLLFNKEAVAQLGLKTMLSFLRRLIDKEDQPPTHDKSVAAMASVNDRKLKKGANDNAGVPDSLLSHKIMKNLSSVATMTEILHHLENFHPWAGKFGLDLADVDVRTPIENNFRAGLASRLRQLRPFRRGKVALRKAALEVGRPVKGNLGYPQERMQTPKTIERMRRSEEHLDTFWACTYDDLKNAGAITSYVDSVWRKQTLVRTPAFTEHAQKEPTPKPKPEATVSGESEATVSGEPLVLPFSALKVGSDTPVSGKNFVIDKEDKQKTRGLPDDRVQADAPAAAPAQLALPQIVFQVSQRAMNTVEFLFFVDGAKYLPAHIEWRDVLNLFVEMGCTAEKLWGSTWKFRPAPETALYGKGPVNLDSPHGRSSSQLWFRYARLNGHFISTRYDIDGANFVLKP